VSEPTPHALDAAIAKHKAIFGVEPKTLVLNQHYIHKYGYWFRGRLHTLCCGKGALYEGIPVMITVSPLVEDFLLAY
jgi:hypothetical protein